MDESLVNLVMLHLSGGTELERMANLSALTSAVRTLCDRDRRSGKPKYMVIAEELPAVARSLRIEITVDMAPPEDAMRHIERQLIEMHRGTRSYLAPAMLAWAWQRDERFTRGFLQTIHFDLEALNDRSEPSPVAIPTQGNSLHNLQGQLAEAQQRLILVAQNHWHMISSEDDHGNRYWPMICAAMRRGVSIDIVAMHPDVGPLGLAKKSKVPNAALLWSHYINAPEFPRQLVDCWTLMAEWNDLYRTFRDDADGDFGNLRMFGAYFNPLTISVIDPDAPQGLIILSPRTSDPRGASRPQFIISKKSDPSAFAYYWTHVAHEMLNHYWARIY